MSTLIDLNRDGDLSYERAISGFLLYTIYICSCEFRMKFGFHFKKPHFRRQESSSQKLVSTYLEMSTEPDTQDRQKRESHMRMMTAFVRRIQCPVADLLGLQTLIDDIPEGSEIFHYASAMNTCGTLLASMIQNMTMYYNISSGIRVPENVYYLFTKDIIKTWTKRTEEDRNGYTRIVGVCSGDLSCDLRIEKGVPMSIIGDSMFVKTIVYNLLDNAIKFTPDGNVKLVVKADKISYNTCSIEIFVYDTGVGIPLICIEKIFEPLVKSHVEYIDGGAGMGLSVCRAICEQMHGDVHVQYSQEKEKDYGESGSVIKATFSVEMASSDLVEEPISMHMEYKTAIGDQFNVLVPFTNEVDRSQHSDTPPKILVVDDVKLIRLMSGRMFGSLHIIPDMAASGKEAIEICKDTLYDLIIMDIMMPEMGGIQTTRSIKQPGSLNEKTVVIGMTSSLKDDMKMDALSSGISDWMTKPVSRDTLYKTMGNHIEPRHMAWIKNKCEL